MNFDALPVIDTHCHPFPPEQGAIDSQALLDAIGVALERPASPINESMMLTRMVVKGLAKLLGCAPTLDAVLEARNAIAGPDPAAYNALLFNDAKIVAALADPGFPSRLIPTEEFAAVLPCPVYEGYRIERFTGWYDDSVFQAGKHASFADFVDEFREILDREAARENVIFYKSVIAYRTGLAINRVSEADAKAAWEAHPVQYDPADKVIRDFLFWETALKAKEHGMPFQVHTGHTSDSNPWPNVNPILLTPLLNEPEMAEVPFVLVHGGYPFCTEAGYITSVFEHVSLDLSLMIPWSSIGIAQRIHETFEFAPTKKVMYGSDGIMGPELFWISALNTRKALSRVLSDLVAEDVLDNDEAMEIAKDIFYRNAERIYGLSIDALASA
jgi:hypothetical protein